MVEAGALSFSVDLEPVFFIIAMNLLNRREASLVLELWSHCPRRLQGFPRCPWHAHSSWSSPQVSLPICQSGIEPWDGWSSKNRAPPWLYPHPKRWVPSLWLGPCPGRLQGLRRTSQAWIPHRNLSLPLGWFFPRKGQHLSNLDISLRSRRTIHFWQFHFSRHYLDPVPLP